MKLTSSDLDYIMRDFPSVKLSYVKNIHKLYPKAVNTLHGSEILRNILYVYF